MGRVGIVGAMHEELRALLPLLADARIERRAGRDFHTGRLGGRDAVLVLSGIGKVAAAITTTLLMDVYAVDELLFTGVAGGVGGGVRVGDVVVAGSLLHHDLDASPLFPKYEVPLTGRSRFEPDARLSDALAAAVERVLADGSPLRERLQSAFGIASPRLHRGLVISGDRFIGRADDSHALRRELPDALAVEMEGAAVAQVCTDYGRPFALVRIVSDRADDVAHVDFVRFIADVAAWGSREIVQSWLEAH